MLHFLSTAGKRNRAQVYLNLRFPETQSDHSTVKIMVFIIPNKAMTYFLNSEYLIGMNNRIAVF